jgi:hypothetical protein
MSYKIAGVLHDGLGLDASVVYGSRPGGAHCWVTVMGVPLEPGTGRYRVDFIDSFPWGYWDELQEDE